MASDEYRRKTKRDQKAKRLYNIYKKGGKHRSRDIKEE